MSSWCCAPSVPAARPLTGVEAISDGVLAFQKPEWSNARTTLTIMITILAVTFGSITFLAHQYGAIPMEANVEGYETVIYQIAQSIFSGWSPLPSLYVQFATMAILVLAANTAYSDLPRLSYFLARDRYMPRQFTFRGTGRRSRWASSRSACGPRRSWRRSRARPSG